MLLEHIKGGGRLSDPAKVFSSALFCVEEAPAGSREYSVRGGTGQVSISRKKIHEHEKEQFKKLFQRENAENVIFLRSLVLTGKIRNACRKALKIGRTMFDQDSICDLPMAA